MSSYAYDVSLNGRDYDVVHTDRPLPILTVKLDLIAQGHPVNINVRRRHREHQLRQRRVVR